ncbi:MAG: DUF1616 domain-containing protein [Candidatus Bathyarchaeia archaeon]|nr:DUF1616 domain-containing protein [Candidatus Bathyarchaeota archaeon]
MSQRIIYAFSVIFAVVIATSMLVFSYYSAMESVARSEEFISFSVLDQDKKAYNYPELLRKNENCTLWIIIKNHKHEQVTCKVMVKIVQGSITSIPVPMEAYEIRVAELNPGDVWEEPVNLTMKEVGEFFIVFELWIYNKAIKDFDFSGDYLVLPVNVIAA